MAKTSRKRSRREPLTRERIERAALELIERDGLEGFSTRRLGEALGCEAMSIYHHFPSKVHLLDALVERVLAEMVLPPHDAPWQVQLRDTAYGYRGAAHKYPKLFPYFALYRMNSPAGLRYINHILRGIHEAGADTETMARVFRCVGYYLVGAGLDETAGYAKGPSSAAPVSDADVARDYPYVAAAGPYFKPEHFAATFDLGIEIFIEGIEHRLAAGKDRAPAGRSSAS
ncbi:MAG: TetR/AcrR family transcriptional regulator [Sulfurifustaceae bacterium]